MENLQSTYEYLRFTNSSTRELVINLPLTSTYLPTYLQITYRQIVCSEITNFKDGCEK